MKRQGWTLLIIILLYTGLSIFDNTYIFTDDFFYEGLNESFSRDTIETILNSEAHLGWIGFVALLFIIIIKVLFMTFCVTTGAIFTDTSFSIKDIFQAVLYSEFIFLASQITYSLNLFFNREFLTIENAGNFYPLSVLSFFNVENVVPWLHYPLQTLNLFEVAYVICIAWLLSKQWKPNFVESLNIVIPSYGLGLLVWMVLVVFLTLQVS